MRTTKNSSALEIRVRMSELELERNKLALADDAIVREMRWIQKLHCRHENVVYAPTGSLCRDCRGEGVVAR